MKIDLHIHSKASDGKFTVQQVFKEAKARGIGFIAITDHDCISSQIEAIKEAEKADIRYIKGVELNVTFSHSDFLEGKNISLDFLGYGFDTANNMLESKLETMGKYRQERAVKILEKLNTELEIEGRPLLKTIDLRKIEETVDGTLGRPHIADYLVKQGIVTTRQEAFDKYLVKCDVPKYPLYIEEASKLIRNAGGKLIIAHPNDPHGTSLNVLSKSLTDHVQILKEKMLPYIDGLECWHSRHTLEAAKHYIAFAKEHELIMTGGSDCHQKPIVMGSVNIPDWVAKQFS
jgi:3',5'-nucleoside bisphosphate phosphatase